MKSILISLFFFGISLSSFAQTEAEVSITSKEDFIKDKAAGSIVMVLPSTITNSDVEKYGKYYTGFFKTAFDEQTHKVTFNMVKNDAKSRRVIIRFLSANGIQFAHIGENTLPLSNFYEEYLK
jgi:hypothetical protein